MTDEPYGDPLSAPFWRAAREKRFLLQRCTGCGRHQHYPRPFCMECQGDVEWVEASGRGTVYSRTTVRLAASPHFEPPYIVAVVELAEGPRITTNVVEGDPEIGDTVRISWLDREDAPPLPVVTTR